MEDVWKVVLKLPRSNVPSFLRLHYCGRAWWETLFFVFPNHPKGVYQMKRGMVLVKKVALKDNLQTVIQLQNISYVSKTSGLLTC